MAGAQHDGASAKVANAAQYVLADEPPSAARLFAETGNVTVNVLAPKAPIKPHYHAKHDETVLIVQGAGKMLIGTGERRVQAGDIIFLPKGTVHSFSPEGLNCVAVSIFAPMFDGADRIFVGG